MTTLAQPFSPVKPRYTVPAEGWGPLRGSSIKLVVRGPLPPQQGHPLRQGGLLLKEWDNLYYYLRGLLGSPQRAELAKEALRLQLFFPFCFPSARVLAGKALSSEKTWDRCLARLRERGWARTWRLYRQDGTQSVNLLDLGGLWHALRLLLSWPRTWARQGRGRPGGGPWPEARGDSAGTGQPGCHPRGSGGPGPGGGL